MSATYKVYALICYVAVLLFVIGSPHPPPTSPTPLLMKHALVNLRQHEIYLKVIMVFYQYYCHEMYSMATLLCQGDILNCSELFTQLMADYATYLESLQKTVQSKTAVPTAQVYVSPLSDSSPVCMPCQLNVILSFVLCSWRPVYFIFQPLFVALSNVWAGFQDNVVMLSVLSNLITGLRPFVKVLV